MYKRRSSVFIEEEEDEWEREASSSKKVSLPNYFTKNIDILDEQYNILNDTTTDLERQLILLQNTLQGLEIQEQDLTTEQQQLTTEYIESIENIISASNTINQEPLINNSHYIKSNEKLCNDLKNRFNQWDKIFELLVEQEKIVSKKIKKLANDYRYTEFDILDLTCQIEGLQACIRSLNHETSKLNTLPQILPILKSEADNYKAEMKNTTDLLGKLEQESIKPALIELSKLKIVAPLDKIQLDKSIQYANLLITDLEKVFDIGIKQKSIQLFISCLNQLKKENTLDLNTLKERTVIIENNIESLSLTDETNKQERENDSTQLQLFNNLLNESKQAELFNQEMTFAEKIHALKDYEVQLKNKWSQDFNSCLDAITELNELRTRLSETLVLESYTISNDTLELETDELKSTIASLQKEIENPKENEQFKNRVKLFSVFYTDPDEFLDLIEKNKK